MAGPPRLIVGAGSLEPSPLLRRSGNILPV
ncbi:hypothetical protein STBA_15960 [Streptomyces sp. MP131-18]|nr:hypothetical protein STBA_15960 [Streptomyces sp. MP131-18]